ncbi:Stress responsive A/B Barrel Domain [Cognatiyoonia koreensis]|uniref:Stress responsive A/B Barrel Domain n=1 Tax=Cognatiyoonia koreensis TaxID=364200 RepID=A0A1I0RXS5_9RHOB|nr:Dabb family protein [Cognatiyoonia koreensis]SEW46348.1 Stress responsive A/B Barrel Domain [Cognatiyoonia koreensis]
MSGRILHVVMLRLAPDTPAANLESVMSGLAALQKDVPGFLEFAHGPNRDFEKKSPEYAYGFQCSFADKDALQSYADNPTHKQLGAKLVAMCVDGANGIWVADIEVG